jgi:predicted LPLAT superfamily acyltransferase
MTAMPAKTPEALGWRAVPEAGTILGIRLVAWLLRAFGRGFVGAFLYLLCVYYALLRGTARRASRAYLAKVGHAATFRDVVQHLHHFAQVASDRVLFLTGKWSSLRIEHHGHELIVEAVESGKGALLLGGHLGSFEAMRALADRYRVPINVVADFSNAERINRVLGALAPGAQLRVISLARGPNASPVTTILAIQAAIARGELVAILADRHDDDADRTVEVPCLGAPARFPVGPWVLAHALACPVYFVAGLYTKPNRYDLYCEPFAEQVRLARGKRDESMREMVTKYAARLEHYAHLAPYNWFNFYDFWGGT